eukprot:4900189-Pyramimonas_sp.AAC.1
MGAKPAAIFGSEVPPEYRSISWRTKNEADESIAAVLVLSRLQGGVRKRALRFAVERDGANNAGENAFDSEASKLNPVGPRSSRDGWDKNTGFNNVIMRRCTCANSSRSD